MKIKIGYNVPSQIGEQVLRSLERLRGHCSFPNSFWAWGWNGGYRCGFLH